ncbi:hypothetical protein B4065_2727 [Caldibacillus thermoamylovorans]|nr:hypothetical protein B4065_2727 [Caldibacillus thermoamylovorans]
MTEKFIFSVMRSILLVIPIVAFEFDSVHPKRNFDTQNSDVFEVKGSA